MKDKEKRELKDGIISIFKRFNILDSTATIGSLKNDILRYINSLQEQPVSEEWIEELRTKLDSMSKEDLKKVFDKYAIDFNEEPVSEDLEEEIDNYVKRNGYDGLDSIKEVKYIANHFAKWQKEQMIKDAIDTAIKQGCTNLGIFIKGLDEDKFSFGDKIKVIIIKED